MIKLWNKLTKSASEDEVSKQIERAKSQFNKKHLEIIHNTIRKGASTGTFTIKIFPRDHGNVHDFVGLLKNKGYSAVYEWSFVDSFEGLLTVSWDYYSLVSKHDSLRKNICDCSVCFGPVNIKNFKLLRCGHVAHGKCYRETKKKCPVCTFTRMVKKSDSFRKELDAYYIKKD